jgi:D-3-phosphoglycerate dehydrogenase
MTIVRYIDCTTLMRELLGDHPQEAAKMDVFVGDPDRSQLATMLRDAELVINGHTAMDAELLAEAPRLRSIVFLGSGPGSYIDLAAAERVGVAVHRVTGYGDRAVAEHAFALLMACARDVAAMDRRLRAGEWGPREGVELSGKTLGVIGVGGIGREMVRIAAGFGMTALAWSRSGVDPALPCSAASLVELLATSDVVSLHLALTPETRRFLDARRLGLMKPGAILINTARGALVDEAALIDALRSGRLRHAGLDVFDVEPLPAGHPLTTLPNVTLTSHAAYMTREASQRLLAAALDIVAAQRLGPEAQA